MKIFLRKYVNAVVDAAPDNNAEIQLQKSTLKRAG